MLILKSLTFQNIGRFVEEQTINFTQLGSLVQIEGQNNNTGGSSGAGKSTIFKALDFLLGLNDVSNSILQSRLTKESMSVTGLFDYNGVPLKIERGKKLLVDLNGDITTGSSKLAEERLDQIIGMPRDLFRKILHKRQGEGGFFLDLGASETHKFLTNCLSLEKEQGKIVKLDGIIKVLSDKTLSVKSQADSYESAIVAIRTAIGNLAPIPDPEIDSEGVEVLKKRHLDAQDLLKLVLDSHKKDAENLEKERPQIKTTPFDRTHIERLESEIGTILAEISSLEDAEKQRCSAAKSKISELKVVINSLNNEEQLRQSSVRNKIAASKMRHMEIYSIIDKGKRAKEEAIKEAAELTKIRSSICPTCEQGWVTDAARAKEAEILKKLQDYKKLVIAGNAANAELESINIQIEQLEIDSKPNPMPEVDDLTSQIQKLIAETVPQFIPKAVELKLNADCRNKELLALRQEEREHQFRENTRQQDILGLYAQKQTELRKTHDLAIKDLRNTEYRTLSEYETAKNVLTSFEENKKRLNESLKKFNAQLLGYSEQLAAKNSELTEIREELELATESKKAIKSYLSCSFEDALDSIGDQATKLIRSIPNMANATIQFEGLKETKEGKVKEEVTCILSMDGEVAVPVKSLSGGERSSTDIAIDLAVIRFIEERTGNGISLMAFDEPFTGLDSQNILEALEMLKEFATDKQLLIVDHNPIAAQSIENRLTVVRDGLTSKVVQQ